MFEFEVKSYKFLLDTEKNSLTFKNNTVLLPTEENKYFSDEIYLKFSNKCNLNCIYCFQKTEKKSIRKIDLNKYDELFNDLSSNYDNFILFGGEPFLEENIYYINQIFTKLDSKKFKVFTNGCFSNDIFTFISGNSKKFGLFVISVDGLEKTHNSRRLSENCDGFNTIFKNIQKLLDIDIDVNIQINIDDNNKSQVIPLVKYINEFFNNNIKIILNQVLHTSSSIEEKEFLEIYINLYKSKLAKNIILNSKVYIKLYSYLAGFGIISKRCNAGNDVVLDFQSNEIYGCPESSKSIIGKFSNHSMDIVKESRDLLVSYSLKKNNKCKDCCLKAFCDLGCFIQSDLENVNCFDDVQKKVEYLLKNFQYFFGGSNKIVNKLNHLLSN